jgi:hypothetical protein
LQRYPHVAICQNSWTPWARDRTRAQISAAAVTGGNVWSMTWATMSKKYKSVEPLLDLDSAKTLLRAGRANFRIIRLALLGFILVV